MYALENGLGMKWLAVLFCLFASFAAFGIGSSTQANSIATMAKNQFGVPPVASGIILAIITFIVIIGGVKSIASVCEKLVPLMAAFYAAGCLVILFLNARYVGAALNMMIISSAFTTKAAAGGFTASTMMMAAPVTVLPEAFSLMNPALVLLPSRRLPPRPVIRFVRRWCP